MIPNEIIKESFDYLPLGDLYNITKESKSTAFITSQKYDELRHKIHFIENNFPLVLIQLFTFKELLNADIIEWKDVFIGNTDYIDRIKLNDVNSYITIGKDPYNRTFICLKLLNIMTNEKFVCTLFQRYSDDLTTWTYGCHSYSNFIKDCGYFLSKNQFRNKYIESNIRKLLSKKQSNLQLQENKYQDYILVS